MHITGASDAELSYRSAADAAVKSTAYGACSGMAYIRRRFACAHARHCEQTHTQSGRVRFGPHVISRSICEVAAPSGPRGADIPAERSLALAPRRAPPTCVIAWHRGAYFLFLFARCESIPWCRVGSISFLLPFAPSHIFECAAPDAPIRQVWVKTRMQHGTGVLHMSSLLKGSNTYRHHPRTLGTSAPRDTHAQHQHRTSARSLPDVGKVGLNRP